MPPTSVTKCILGQPLPGAVPPGSCSKLTLAFRSQVQPCRAVTGLCSDSSAKGAELPLLHTPLHKGVGAVISHTNWLNFKPDFCTRVSFGLVCSQRR